MKNKPDVAARPGRLPKLLFQFLKWTFFSGPRQLLTSRISVKCAAMMMAMCAPSLLCCALLVLPAVLFQSPQQHAYFQFARELNEDPTRWLVLGFAGICALLSLALPAAIPDEDTAQA